MHNKAAITLVIFTCEGKEHLLPETYASFKEACDYPFIKTILAIDGQIDQQVIQLIKPDLIVQNFDRKGYVVNIINALKAIETPYFFWLEDDWLFEKKFDLEKFQAVIEQEQTAVQVVLSKSPYIEENNILYANDLYISKLGFSANPCLCRTDFIKLAFHKILAAPKTEETKILGFEGYLNQLMTADSLKTLIIFNESKACVFHNGNLESTAREYHMINSLSEDTNLIGKEYISGYGNDREISLFNKLSLLPKFWLAAITLSIKLFRSRQAYDYAFRIFLSYLKNFKN